MGKLVIYMNKPQLTKKNRGLCLLGFVCPGSYLTLTVETGSTISDIRR